MSEKVDTIDECLRISCRVSSSAVMVYNLIREVGRGELSADNALHQMIEVYHNLSATSDMLDKLANILEDKR